MCGRYALGIRAAFVRYQLQQQNIPVDEAPEDGEARESYNFAPGYNGLVYRMDTQQDHHQHNEPSDAVSQSHDATAVAGGNSSSSTPAKYKLQAMKWGLVPFWTKRNPDYGTLMRTINCRDDSLMENRGMWTSMKKTKRCVVIAQGFYEWQKKNNGKERIPHFVKRKDGQLMLLAGLWDRVRYEDSEEDLWTYTIITTDNNKQLAFLHDRMPVILEPDSEQMWKWLDPTRQEWSNELQSVLQPYSQELDCYVVSKDVGKVGNNSPEFIVPVASKANKQNIANFFNAPKENPKELAVGTKYENPVKHEDRSHQEAVIGTKPLEKDARESQETGDRKRGAEEDVISPKKAIKTEMSPMKPSVKSATAPLGKKARDATSNGSRAKITPSKIDSTKSKKITSFFSKT